jgi:hypothetical protein
MQEQQGQSVRESVHPEQDERKSVVHVRKSMAQLGLSENGNASVAIAHSENGDAGDAENLARDLQFVHLLAEHENGPRKSRMMTRTSKCPVSLWIFRTCTLWGRLAVHFRLLDFSNRRRLMGS